MTCRFFRLTTYFIVFGFFGISTAFAVGPCDIFLRPEFATFASQVQESERLNFDALVGAFRDGDMVEINAGNPLGTTLGKISDLRLEGHELIASVSTSLGPHEVRWRTRPTVRRISFREDLARMHELARDFAADARETFRALTTAYASGAAVEVTQPGLAHPVNGTVTQLWLKDNQISFTVRDGRGAVDFLWGYQPRVRISPVGEEL